MILSNSRTAGYDIARILSCILVYLSHTPGSLTQIYGSELACVYVSSINDSSLVMFFMISGAFILGKPDNTRDFFRRRFKRILIPMAVFTVGYTIYEVKMGSSLYRILTRVLFEGIANQSYWFLYTLCGLYLVTPILSQWLRAASRKEVAFYLGIWLITTCFPFYNEAFGYNPYDSSVFRLIRGYTGAYVAGYYIHRYIDATSRKALTMIIAFGTSAIIIPLIELYVDKGWYGLWDCNYNCVGFGIAILLLILRISGNRKSSPAVALIANLTFGMYLLNTIVNYFLSRWGLTSGLSLREGYALFFPVSLASSLIITYICSRVPILRKAVGL